MKVKFNPFLKEVRGKIGKTVFRLCHTGEWQIAARPDMSRVKWSEKQKEHRRKFQDAVDYAKVCMMLPELRAYYLERAHKRGTNRPFDEAVREFFKDNILPFDYKRPQDILAEQNTAASTGTKCQTSDPALENSPRVKPVAINEQNRPQRAGFASSSSTKAVPASAGGPATNDNRWIVASLVRSDSMYEEGSIACCFGYSSP